ncbi:MAG: hypothetical protein KGY99_11085 [Phycisphaerae bacterium]|nr:hypothetical protein [Phycisphaerae bacterium]
MFLKWLPWKYLARRLAKAHGFLDPVSILARLERFAQPSEVATPMELLRAGVVFHARGLMNTKVIQQNLDWIWPYWVQRQFDPDDAAFVPRAFSLTHVNLTHRNWTALGLPGCNAFPLVDPRGLLTPLFDGWSLDAWVVADDGTELLCPAGGAVTQRLVMEADGLGVETIASDGPLTLRSYADVAVADGAPVCRLRCRAEADRDAWLAIVLRPFNPEGVSFVHDIRLDAGRRVWRVNRAADVRFETPAQRHVTSTYVAGDVHTDLLRRDASEACRCEVGLASAAALVRVAAGEPCEQTVRVDLSADKKSAPVVQAPEELSWSAAMKDVCSLQSGERRFDVLYDAAVRTMRLLCPADPYPGPFTYKRFWFRDAVFILHAMLCAGFEEPVERAMGRFLRRQHVSGFFHSQTGEWDSNGQVLWLLLRFGDLTGCGLEKDWRKPVVRAARWIVGKRCASNDRGLHAGLMPAGFSAEHLGNNDFYYWDDFWSQAGLHAAEAMCRRWGDGKNAERFRREADDLARCIDRTLDASRDVRRHAGIPASPYRRMDAGAVGSLAAGYPLGLRPAADPDLLATVDYLLRHCLRRGAFFQEMIHSGCNAYLTLQVAQVLLRAGDRRFFDLVCAVAELASPTGQWPEAIHPRTGGGCMGDGQHAWAAAEWVMMMRHMFVRETDGGLAIGSGIPPAWQDGRAMRLGPTPTPYGPVCVTLTGDGETVTASWQADWRGAPPRLDVCPPGRRPQTVERPDGEGRVTLARAETDGDAP